MAPKAAKITVKALQGLLTRIGSASSGSKDLLRHRFDHDIRTSRLFGLKLEWAARQRPDSDKKLRIVSIDMGIKNPSVLRRGSRVSEKAEFKFDDADSQMGEGGSCKDG